jgi:NADH:ubiquinone oxidoreductase subunit F (NADH-binding)
MRRWYGRRLRKVQRRFFCLGQCFCAPVERDAHKRPHIGAGSYVCGEETAMINSIEGKRPQVRVRPPQIVEHGIFGTPTLVNNVETLCAVPWIIAHGAAAYAAYTKTHEKNRVPT